MITFIFLLCKSTCLFIFRLTYSFISTRCQQRSVSCTVHVKCKAVRVKNSGFNILLSLLRFVQAKYIFNKKKKHMRLNL